MLTSKYRDSGFTIVELLIVIVVIAILAAISTIAYNGIQTRAKASSLATAIKNSDKAFQLQRIDEWNSTWPTYAGNPTFATLISSTKLNDYLQTTPSVSGMSGIGWEYDYDGDSYNGCSMGAAGPNFLIRYLGDYEDIVRATDEEIDDGNLGCGKLRYNSTDAGGTAYWSLGKTAND